MPVSLTMMDQLSGFALSIGMMQYLKKYQLTSDLILILRICYGISIALNILILYIIKKRILNVKDVRTVKIQPQKSFFNTNEDEEEIEITHEEFDMNEYKKLIKMCMLQAVVISLGHMKWGMVQPLFIQIFSIFKMILFSPLFLCYLRNYEIQRPYEKNMLFDMKKKEKVMEKKSKKKED